jgi:hypothetical protein
VQLIAQMQQNHLNITIFQYLTPQTTVLDRVWTGKYVARDFKERQKCRLAANWRFDSGLIMGFFVR